MTGKDKHDPELRAAVWVLVLSFVGIAVASGLLWFAWRLGDAAR
jgi:hypothetical protein